MLWISWRRRWQPWKSCPWTSRQGGGSPGRGAASELWVWGGGCFGGAANRPREGGCDGPVPMESLYRRGAGSDGCPWTSPQIQAVGKVGWLDLAIMAMVRHEGTTMGCIAYLCILFEPFCEWWLNFSSQVLYSFLHTYVEYPRVIYISLCYLWDLVQGSYLQTSQNKEKTPGGASLPTTYRKTHVT